MLPLCSDSEGWRWAQGLFVQPQQQTVLGWKGEAEKKVWEWVQRGRCTPARNTFGVNKVWKSDGGRVNATDVIASCYAVSEGQIMNLPFEQLRRGHCRGAQYSVVKRPVNWCLQAFSKKVWELRCKFKVKMDSLWLIWEPPPQKKEQKSITLHKGNTKFVALTQLNWTV